MARLAFRTFDWLMAERIASHEFNAGRLDEEQRRMIMLGIYPNQSTVLHLIASKTEQENESRSVDQLKWLLEPEQDPSDIEVTEKEGVDTFKVPIIFDANGN